MQLSGRLLVFLSLAFLIIEGHGRAFALDCPKMPEQINKDWEVEVNAAIAKIGPVKGGELRTRTNNATKDLLGKLPDAGRVYLKQMMYSAYCSALRDDNTIKESEKAKLLMEYNREVRKAITTSPPFVPKPATKPSKDQSKGETKTQQKLKSAPAKNAGKPAKPLTVDKEKKQETLIDFFKNDFNNLLRVTQDAILSTEPNEQTIIKSQGYLDFESQTIFIGFYIPNTTHTYAICVALASNYDRALEQLRKTAMVEFSHPGMQPVNSSELRFSGRVFLYHEYPLLEEQKRELFSLYKAKGLSPQFRDWKYVYEKNKESLTSGSTGSPRNPAPGEP
jgi:hypothetical protein